jgi:hypothetical protein
VEKAGMKWLTLVVTAWMSFVSVATASLAPPRKSPGLDKELARALATSVPPALVQQTTAPAAEPEFNVTNETEILLDGRPCSFKDVPADASILKMEVAADRKTAQKIHFRTRK